MTPEEFEEAVADGLDAIPPDLAAEMDNVVILVEAEPPSGQEPTCSASTRGRP